MRELASELGVRAPCSHCEGVDLIPGPRARIPQATRRRQKQKQKEKRMRCFILPSFLLSLMLYLFKC